MKKAIVAMAALALGSSAAAQTFVHPAKWSTSAPAEAKRGGTFRDFSISEFKTYNPFTSSEASNIPDEVSSNGNGFLRFDVAANDYVPFMASSYTVSPDKLVWTFNVRKGMKWSDGKPIVADDWITTFKIHTDEDVGSNSYDGFFINDKPIVVSKVDADTVRIVFPTVDATAVAQAGFAPWPSHIFAPVYASKGAAGIKAMWSLSTKPEDIVSSGAFKLESYRIGERVVLERNPFYGEWNKDSAGAALPYLDNYSFNIVKDQNAALAAYLAGQIDTFGVRGADDLRQIKAATDSGGLKAVLRPNIGAAASSQWIVWNWNRKSDPFKQKIFRDANFRRAMSHLTNRAAMVNIVLGGLGQPAYTSVYSAFTQWVSPTAKKFDYNLEAAAGLLTKAGFSKKNSEGFLVDRSGKVLEFDLATNAGNTTREAYGKIFADEAKKVGVKVNFRPIDFNTLVAQLTSEGEDRKFDSILLGLSGGSRIYPLGQNVEPCGTNLHAFNTSGKCLAPWETSVTALYARGRQELDTPKRVAIAKQIQDIQSAEQAWVYLVSPNVHFTYNARVRGEFPTALASSINGSRSDDLALTWIAQ
jgi:peptide/nickel transport system substrate-binding protein